jgi:hypothetical protein
MKAPLKPLRKKDPEPLDWRSLADGPALRGLTEVLAHPPTVEDTPTEVLKPTVVISTTVNDSPSVGVWKDSEGNLFDPRRIVKVVNANQSMSLGEERVYRTLWEASEADGIFPVDAFTKTFSLGYDRLAKLVRLNEKSVRLLIPKMIHKMMLEITAPERSAERAGRTYRIFSEEQILIRQRAAGLRYVAKRGRAIEFVTLGVTTTVGLSNSV